MHIIHFFLQYLDKVFPFPRAHAHCDIPCGVYTAHQAGIAAETVQKMVDKIIHPPAYNKDDDDSVRNYHNTMTRYVLTKEEWAQICKQELLILWTDYFKPEHLEMFPNLHEIFWKAAKLCSQNKREVNAEAAKKLCEAVDEISEIFRKAEGEKAVAKRQEWL